MSWKKIIKCIVGLGTFLLLLLVAVLFSCTILFKIDQKNKVKELEPIIVKTNAQIDFVFENGKIITPEDFVNGVAVKEFKVINRSSNEVDIASLYQMNFNIEKKNSNKLGELLYSISSKSDGTDEDDKAITSITSNLPSFSSSIGMGSIRPGVTHEYKVTIKNEGNVDLYEQEFKLEIVLSGNITYLYTNK